jgi:hypothetical protein
MVPRLVLPEGADDQVRALHAGDLGVERGHRAEEAPRPEPLGRQVGLGRPTWRRRSRRRRGTRPPRSGRDDGVRTPSERLDALGCDVPDPPTYAGIAMRRPSVSSVPSSSATAAPTSRQPRVALGVQAQRLLDDVDRRCDVEAPGRHDVLLREEPGPSLAHGRERQQPPSAPGLHSVAWHPQPNPRSASSRTTSAPAA